MNKRVSAGLHGEHKRGHRASAGHEGRARRVRPRPFRHAGPGPLGAPRNGGSRRPPPAATPPAGALRPALQRDPPPQKGTVRAASPGHPLGTQRRAFARCRPPKRVKAPPVSRPPQARGGRCRLWAAGGRAAPPGPRRGPARCGAVLLHEAFLRSSA